MSTGGRINILVTGVGAIIGYGIIRSLRQYPEQLNIIGMDIYDDAIGQYWCDDFVQAVPAKSEEYPDFIRTLISEKNIHLVIPGIEQDVSRLSLERLTLADCGASFVLNRQELITVAHDKWETHKVLSAAGYETIPTMIEGGFYEFSETLGLPFLLKPRRSYASKGIQQIASEEDLLYWRRKLGDEFMVQKIIGNDDDEYTVGLFGYGDGTFSHSISLRRKLSGEGATAKAWLVHDPALDVLVFNLAELFKPLGPTNFQFRKHEGHYLLLEVNPRISSSASLRTAFGFNESIMCIDYFLNGKRAEPRPLRQGHALRFIEDYVIYDGDSV